VKTLAQKEGRVMRERLKKGLKKRESGRGEYGGEQKS